MDAMRTMQGARAAEKRIKQLLSRNKEERLSAEYLQRVVALLIPFVPKTAVSRILDAARSPQPTAKGKTYVSFQEQHGYHENQPGPAEGAGAAGRQGTFCRDAQAGA